ncbi:uncharacterized protein LOC105683061 isoform X2 [Athalia rosae]|uniref:uncharacterized protein LOC105683061 isoform X2 n=1 Tax=Athalia rosae TaxID=37344 RepID=UPI0020347219|nr:uncharacterized protein LOC105683061 isoform X2 [Athalia rosae]
MGKKGAKRKTRWRSLSIGAPPGEEDEEEEVRKGYQLENGIRSARGDRSVQSGYSSYKRTRPYNNATNTYGYGYGSLYNGQSKSTQAKNDEDPTKPKIVFNEEEYMRITTPRQDVLFKKGYLSRKKPLASTASTSATSATTTPSTNESQSAAHSTADGSETAEDQQLLDGGYGGEFAIVPEGAAQFAYGGFYDQVTGYYYEYPVMLVGPPVPGHSSPNVLAAMPCGPVPLRPVEWFNPQYVPETLQDQHQPLHSTDSQAGSCGSSVSMDELGGTGAAANAVEASEVVNSNETKDEELTTRDAEGPIDEGVVAECIPSSQIIPQIIPHMHMPPQHYVYPGHFMFGPPMVNMNGVTIQNGAIIPSEALWVKRRKKRKRRKQRRPLAVGNTEDEEEEYSSEWESSSNWSQPAWSTSTTTTITNDITTSRPLNPEVQEFQFRSTLPILADTTDVRTPDAKDTDTQLASRLTEITKEECGETEVGVEPGVLSINNTVSLNLNDEHLKDESTENTLENERLKEKNGSDVKDETISHVIDTEKNVLNYKAQVQSNGNGEIINDNSDNCAKDASNISVNASATKPLANGNSIDEDSNNLVVSIDSKGIVGGPNKIKSQTSLLEDSVNNSNESKEDIHDDSNTFQAKPEKTGEVNNGNSKSAALKVEKCNASPLSNSKKPQNETPTKKNGNKSVKKGKGKSMDIQKSVRNKGDSKNPQRNETTSNTVSSESLAKRGRSASPRARQPLNSESSRSESPLTKPSSRPTSPEINQMTTPINAETHRLPESYESLVTRSTPRSVTPPLTAGIPVAPPRRKYSAKGIKFIREPTPGPDLDTDIKSDNEEAIKIDNSLRTYASNSESCASIDHETTMFSLPENTVPQNSDAEKNIEVAAEDSVFKDLEPSLDVSLQSETISNESSQRIDCQLDLTENEVTSISVDYVTVNNSNTVEAVPTTSVGENTCQVNSICLDSNKKIGVDNLEAHTISKLSDHPITDAVTAWLERTKSPEEMFKVPMRTSESDDSDLSETEIFDDDPDEQPSKNLQGNPMPALSVSNGSIDKGQRTRSNVVTSGNITKTDTFVTSKNIVSRREKDINNLKVILSPTNNNINNNNNGSYTEAVSRSVRVCEFTTQGSAAGMRVAENSRVNLNKVNMENNRFEECSNKKNYIENIEMKIQNNKNSNKELPENGIEALENVKTYERGEIIVTLDGKLLTGTIFEPTCSAISHTQVPETVAEVCVAKSNRINRTRSLELNESFVTSLNNEHEMSPEETLSLGSIEEPDVLECWETEMVEPVLLSKNSRQMMKLQVDGQVHDGEAMEEENYDNHKDPTVKEYVKKYYRLAREYTLSVEDELSERALKQTNSNNISSNSNSNSPKRATPNTPERMIECLCSEEIPIIVPLPKSTSTEENNVVNADGKQIEAVDEAFEVYESCYTVKTRLPTVTHLNIEGSKIPFQNQEGPVPCKAVCCSIQ